MSSAPSSNASLQASPASLLWLSNWVRLSWSIDRLQPEGAADNDSTDGACRCEACRLSRHEGRGRITAATASMSLQDLDVRGLRALRALRGGEAHPLVLLEGTEPAAVDGGEVGEHVAASVIG